MPDSFMPPSAPPAKTFRPSELNLIYLQLHPETGGSRSFACQTMLQIVPLDSVWSSRSNLTFLDASATLPNEWSSSSTENSAKGCNILENDIVGDICKTQLLV
jgi:hypothetical protein